MINITEFQTTLMFLFPLLLLGVGFFVYYTKVQQYKMMLSGKEKKLVQDNKSSAVTLKKVDFSLAESGWQKGRKIDFNKYHIPLSGVLSGHTKPSGWRQPAKIGANELITQSKNFISKFGPCVFALSSLKKEDSANLIGWGLAQYLQSEGCRVLVLEISMRFKGNHESTRIELGNKTFDELPDPQPSIYENVDVVTFEPAFTWPEEILTIELMQTFCNHYKKIYAAVLLVTPPFYCNGFGRKAAQVADAYILIADERDTNPELIDAYLRINNSIKSENPSLVVWGLLEKSGV